MKLISDAGPLRTTCLKCPRLKCRGLECRRVFLSALVLLVSSVGCQQRAASKLQGRWEGRPDTSATRAKRESEKFGEVSADLVAEGSVGRGSAGQAIESKQGTDWGNYEVTIVIDFVSSERVEMSLGDREPVSGTWKIVSTSPAACAIEVQTESQGAEDEQPTVVRRRFELLLDEREGSCVGFLLTEAGADRQQGAIYFQRPQVSDAVR